MYSSTCALKCTPWPLSGQLHHMCTKSLCEIIRLIHFTLHNEILLLLPYFVTANSPIFTVLCCICTCALTLWPPPTNFSTHQRANFHEFLRTQSEIQCKYYLCTHVVCTDHRVHRVLALSTFWYSAQQVFSCWLAWWQVGNPSVMLGHSSRECTPPYLSTRISNLLQPAQAEVVLGHSSMYLASWVQTVSSSCKGEDRRVGGRGGGTHDGSKLKWGYIRGRCILLFPSLSIQFLFHTLSDL